MSLRLRFTAYLVAVHLAFLAALVLVHRQRPLLFLALELLVLASLALGLRLLRRVMLPLAYTRQFHDLLQDQHYAARLQPGGDAELDLLVALFNDRLGALYAERLKVGEQRGLLDRLLEATPSAVIVFDFDGAVSLMNASAHALLDPAAAHGAHMKDQLDALPLGDSQLLADPDGRRYRAQRGQFYDRSFTRHFLIVEELTEELERSEKEAYDSLVRVLAHEVNNTVAATGSVLESLLYYRDQLGAADRQDFSTAIVAVGRRNASLGEFIERFTRVLKMPAPELRPVVLKDLLDDIVYLYRDQCRGRAIDIAWRRCEVALALPMDRQLMEQALLNIVKNALEAVEAGRAAQAGPAEAYIHLDLVREDGRVKLSIVDSGRQLRGVPARQLFTPFFTTRKGGQGIGLPFVREVLKRHGYSYRLAPDAAGDTSFDIWLPWPAPPA